MNTHIINVTYARERAAKTNGYHSKLHNSYHIEYQNNIILNTENPMTDTARYLLDNSLANEDDELIMKRGDMVCMKGKIGSLSKVIVEDSKRGLSVIKYNPFPKDLFN